MNTRRCEDMNLRHPLTSRIRKQHIHHDYIISLNRQRNNSPSSMFRMNHMSAIKPNPSKIVQTPKPNPHHFSLPRTPPTFPLHLRLPLHQPHGLLQHHEIPLQHLRPILHIPKLPHSLQRLIDFPLQFPALAREPFARFVELRLLRVDGGGVAVEVCGAGL